MEKERLYEHFWLRGGLIGLFIPLSLFGLFMLLRIFNVQIRGITVFLVFTMFIMQVPIATIGDLLKLPINAGGAAFILSDFNVLGNILVLIFWSIAGALIGWIVDRKRLRENNKSFPK